MKRVLLIDDDLMIITLIEKILKGYDYELICHSSLDEAIASIHSLDALDIALVDFWLEGKNATPILDALNEKFPELPVILISGGGLGVSLETTAAIGDLSGTALFLQKPFTRKELLEAI